MGSLFTGTLGIVLIVFLIVIAILWILLPFEIFGMKKILRELLAEAKNTNAQIAMLNEKKESSYK